MKVSINWLKEFVDLNTSVENLVAMLPLRTIGTKEVTDRFIELDMKGYNRADLLSMRGVAYEVAAITGSKIRFSEPDESQYFWIQNTLPPLEVKVENEEASPFYCLVKIDGLTVEQSSKDIQQKLADSGIRTVNNIADITNIIMLEYGQPLHSFDAGEIKDQTIIVRNAAEGEKLTTLDGKERTLLSEDIVIADPEKAVGLAGVMGGINSEITANTTSILLEAAIFNPNQLRRTSNRLNLTSEASKRFYHGLTKKRLLQGLNAAILMYEKLGGRVNGIAIVGDIQAITPQIPLRLDKIIGLVGTPITPAQVEEYLQSLNFNLMPQKDANGNSGWVVTPPYYRLDIEFEEDVIEEIARLYGYEQIPAKPLSDIKPEVIDQAEFELITNVKKKLVTQGFTEVQTYSFYSTDILNALEWSDDRKHMLLKLANPMSKETEYMRQTIWANLVEVAAKNIKQGVKDIQIFEVGKVYQLNQKLEFTEFYSLGLAVVGDDERSSLTDKTALKVLHQQLMKLLKEMGINATIKQGLGQLPVELYHPNRQYMLLNGDTPIGGFAEVHPRVLFKLGVEGMRVAVAEISLSEFLNESTKN